MENALLALILGAMMTIPLLEIVLRRVLHTGISNQSSIVQHLTLLTGMLGAAIAARDGKLLTLGLLDPVLRGRPRLAARVLCAGVAATISAMLLLASVQFIASERAGGMALVYGVKRWVVELVIPIGFGLIAARVVWRSSESRRGRAAALLLALLLTALALRPPVAPSALVVPAFVLLLGTALLGAPIFAILGGAGLILFWGEGSPIGSLTVDHYSLVTNPTLPTVPLFTLAGFLLAAGGAARRLVRLFQALVGRLRGGPAILVALLCAFFTSFTGASGVTILALGGLLMPVMLGAGYSERTSLGLVTSAGSLGLLIPPCLPLIFYGVIAGVDIRDMFMGGLLPGLLLIIMMSAWGVIQAPPVPAAAPRFDGAELRRAAWDARWELLVPVVAIGGLFSGLATPVETAALTALYCFVIETFVYRDLRSAREVADTTADAGMLIGGVLLILGVALGFTNYLTFAEVPARAVEWVTATVQSRWAVLLLINAVLIIVGGLMDVYSAIVIVAPLLVPLGAAYHIEPVHLGIIFLANLELGFLTPPVGENVFIASLRFDRTVAEVSRAVIPMWIVLFIGVMLITYLPALTTWLPAVIE